jgi:DNA-binding NarL/FixJ family response regulator
MGLGLPIARAIVDSHAASLRAALLRLLAAADFLTKPIERDALLDALRRARLALLTPREREVFDRIVAGEQNRQIGQELGVSERTVKAERAQVMAKLGAGSAAELGRLAERFRRLSGG